MRLVIDCDDAAENLKQALYEHAKALGYEIDDLAYQKTHDCDYPDVAFNLARKVAAGEYDRGILVCGTGLGVAMCANKVQGAYAGTCHDVFSAERLKPEGCGIHNRNYLRELRCGTAVVQLGTGRAEYLPDPRCGSGTFMHWYILGENRRKRWSGIPDPVPVSGIGKCIRLLLSDDRCVG